MFHIVHIVLLSDHCSATYRHGPTLVLPDVGLPTKCCQHLCFKFWGWMWSVRNFKAWELLGVGGEGHNFRSLGGITVIKSWQCFEWLNSMSTCTFMRFESISNYSEILIMRASNMIFFWKEKTFTISVNGKIRTFFNNVSIFA